MLNHSSLIGGSTAARLLVCPGSWAATLALPPSADRPSEYAEEGSFGHAVMDRVMRNRQIAQRPGTVFNAFVEARRWKGERIYDRDLTQEHLDTMIEPALVALATLEAEYGGGFEVAGVEVRVQFPNLPSAFGTADLLLISATHALLCDWKFGQGVGVRAVYSSPAGDTVNAQLMYYLTAALNTSKKLFTRRKLAVAIIQPRADEALTHTEVTRKEVKWFAEDVENAVIAALGRDPPLRRSEECRWCPAKISCPEWTNAILDLTALGQPPTRIAPATTPQPYGEYLARAKALVDVFAMFSKEINDQLHSFLEDGGVVPGWRLKAKAKQRQWIDEDTVEKELIDLGFNLDEIWRSQLVTFATAEAAAKRHGVKIPDHLRVAPPTNETTVCPTDDPAPVVERAGVVEAFRESLKLLTTK